MRRGNLLPRPRVKVRGVRKTLFLALLCGCAALPSRADVATRQKLIQYFGGWYSYFPGTRVSVTESREVALPGLETYRVERHSDSKLHQESNIALYDRTRDEIFVGDVFHHAERVAENRHFEAKDVPTMLASLQDAFGLPVKAAFAESLRGPLRPMTISIRQEKDAFATRKGFASTDGATVLLGEFHPASESAAAFRERLLQESPGVRLEEGGFIVTEFLDFQCERCRVRTPQVRKAVAEKGGALEVRFLPLVKVHDWAFWAAECAAALAGVKPELYKRYEETLFARDQGINASAARELASDIAEAAGAKEKFEAELSSGRARGRVLRDIELAMRLGISGAPSFIHRGTFISGEKDLLESYVRERAEALVQGSRGGNSE